MKVLIIEDEHKIAQSIKKGLEQEMYAVDIAYEGISGFDLAVAEDYDVIILDRLLPGLDGITIAKNLRKNTIHTPILMLTAKGLVEDRVEGLDAGVDDYLPKPFAFSELVARIRALTRRSSNTVSTVLIAGDLTLDTVSYVVKRDSIQIKLSSKEFALLEYLMRNKNKIITKDQIINHVWSYDDDVLPNTVEVWILHLRKKIDKAFSDKPSLIHTVRGFGYKLANGE